jgi:O-antigen ligase
MIKQLFSSMIAFQKDTPRLTLWMNNLLVVYAFFTPINSSITSQIFFTVFILFLVRGNVAECLKEAWENKVARAFVYMITVYVIWMIGSDDLKSGLDSIGKIKSSLYLLLFLVVIDRRYVDKILGAFILGMMLSEILSYSMFLGMIPWEYTIAGEHLYKAYAVGDPSPFLHHIHYGLLLAFTVVLLAQRLVYSDVQKWMKIIMTMFVMTASMNIFITGGRTGYVAFFPLVALFVLYYHKRWILPALVGLVMFSVGMYELSPILQKKVDQTLSEVQKLSAPSADFQSSLGQRAGFLMYSGKVIKENFWLGVGTGDAMDAVFAKVLPKDESVKEIAHEHNQYISVMLQFGIIGLLFFLNIFYQIYRYENTDTNLRFIQLAVTLMIALGLMMTMFNLRVLLHLWILILAVSMIPKQQHTIQCAIPEGKNFVVQVIGIGVFFYLAVFASKLLE